MRSTTTALLFLCGAALVISPVQSERASASCAAPLLRVGGDVGAAAVAGSEITVRGRFFVDGCDDMAGQSGPGCSASPVTTEAPLQDIHLSITQRGRTWPLGEADAGGADDDRLGRVEWAVTLPTELRPGPATLSAEGAEPYELRIGRTQG